MSVRVQGRPVRLDFPLVAVLGKRGRFLVAEPLFGARGARVAVDPPARGPGGKGASEGDLVLVGAGKRGARILRRLGRPDVARDVLEGLMLDRGLRRSFPRAVEAEAAEEAERPFTKGSRLDLRELPTFTIDPDDAKDFDDAVSAERLDRGVVRLWVHIADVSAYVRPGTALERETCRRGTSVYVPGAVEPMLPEALSNRACSLRPGEDRLAVTVEMDIAGTDVRRVEFHRSLIRSDRRLTYAEVDDVFAGRSRAEQPWGGPLAAAREVARALSERREQRGALEVTSHEPVFRFDPDGRVAGVRAEEQSESHALIEELMILANEQVAGYLADRKLPALYRVHERPDPQKVEFMVAQLASLDIPTPSLPRHMSPQQAANLAAECSRLAAAEVRRGGRGRASFGSLVLRSLKQAYYS
ncbi:MAG: RNB domain-containing ribonuclease, partial [Thermoleophilaceae bacterium]